MESYKKIGKIDLIDRTDTLNLENLRENNPKYLVLHSTRKRDFEEIFQCHRDKGWNGAGYHLYISSLNDVFQGRPFNLEGAHALGFNTNSIGLCIYSPNGIPNKKSVKLGRELINRLKESYLNIKLISHTLAQVKYNNKLLEEFGIGKKFIETQDVVQESLFEKIKEEMSELAGRLITSEHNELKNRLKWFKNCPGEMFYKFI